MYCSKLVGQDEIGSWGSEKGIFIDGLLTGLAQLQVANGGFQRGWYMEIAI